MGVTNSVVDPWIYILFRKEVLLLVITGMERFTGKKFEIKHELSGASGTGDSNKASIRTTPFTGKPDSPSSTTLTNTCASDDGGVYKG
jgi:hypothetical protein